MKQKAQVKEKLKYLEDYFVDRLKPFTVTDELKEVFYKL